MNSVKVKLPLFVKKILKKFIDGGFEIYIVGGVVRDILSEKKPIDWDFTTSARPEEILKLFPDAFYDNKFGTVGVTNPEEENKKDYFGRQSVYEITTFRTESGYSDRRRPDSVSWGKTVEEDLKRRDFTINALALRLVPRQSSGLAQGKLLKVKSEKEEELEIIDLFGGQEDLGVKLIRAVGNPDERFSEDALRMIRAIRLATQLGFKIEDRTLAAIKKNAGLIKHVSWERIRDELLKLLSYEHAADGFTFLLSSGLLELVMPEVIRGYGVKQARHHIYDVWTHSLMSLKHCPAGDPIVKLAAFLHDVGKPIVAQGEGEARTFYNHEVVGARIARRIAERLRFSKKQKEKLVTLVRWHQFSVDEHQTEKAARRFIRRVGKENLKEMVDLRIGDRLGGGCKTETSWRLRKFLKMVEDVQKHTPSVKDLKVDGHEVMKVLGIKPGPKVGEVLEALFEEIMEDRSKNTREYLLGRIREIGGKGS